MLGYLDDLVVVPLGALLAIRFIPPDLTAEFRREADEVGERPASRAGATMVVALWLLSAAVLLWALVDSTGA